ncbi:hypothetical protein C8Q74DRAFT_1303755 [Fomes fomentarius]|nr:hypothetical protein C8Q74DRAFT_1303755 [Fomes fomentarius]
MSDLNNEAKAQIIASYNSLQDQHYIFVAITGLVVYEYIITFTSEVELFWKRKFTTSSALFYVTRYIACLLNLYNVLGPDPTIFRNLGCPVVFYTFSFVEYMQYLPWALFSALRAYALSAKSWLFAVIVFLSSVVPMVVNLITTGHATVVFDSESCTIGYNESSTTVKNFTIIARVCLIASDLLVMGITWNATFRTSKAAQAIGQKLSLSTVLFRDGWYIPSSHSAATSDPHIEGAIYFIVLAIMNALHLIFSLVSVWNKAGSNVSTSDMVLFIEPITAILTWRFLIDLQEAHNIMTYQSHSRVSAVESRSLRFNRMLGSLGASLLSAPGPGERFETAGTSRSSELSETEETGTEDEESARVAAANNLNP